MSASTLSVRTARGAAVIVLSACGMARAQYSTGFEPPAFVGSAAGTSINGQGGWYTPFSFTNDALVCTYAGSALGFVPPPGGGGTQFILCHPFGNPARCEYVFDFTNSTRVVFEYDTCVIIAGSPTLPVTEQISSFALQPLGARIFFASNRYANVNDPAAGWYVGYFVAPPIPGGGINLAVPVIAGPAWQGLAFNHWYRLSTTVDLTLNKIISVAITDRTTGVTTGAAPTDWYLNGGTDPVLGELPPANIVRFSGNNAFENNTAFDNFAFAPPAPPPACYANCDHSTVLPCLNVQDFGCFLNKFASGDTYANCDNSTIAPVLNVQDFGCFLNRFASGCSGC